MQDEYSHREIIWGLGLTVVGRRRARQEHMTVAVELEDHRVRDLSIGLNKEIVRPLVHWSGDVRLRIRREVALDLEARESGKATCAVNQR